MTGPVFDIVVAAAVGYIVAYRLVNLVRWAKRRWPYVSQDTLP